jgi:hypothetical protein
MPNVYFDKDTVDTKPSEISICGTRAILPQTRLEMGAARPAPLELASTLKWLSWREGATFFALLCQVTECDSKSTLGPFCLTAPWGGRFLCRNFLAMFHTSQHGCELMQEKRPMRLDSPGTCIWGCFESN